MNIAPQMTSATRIHLAATIAAAVAFHAACSYSSGWLIPLASYVLAMTCLFRLLQRFGPLSKAQKMGLLLVQLTATPAFVAALWFSGKLASQF